MKQTSVEFALEIRKLILKLIFKANASHIGGALSMTDILAVLYNDILRIDPLDPKSEQRDRFLLSKGHACTGLYATLGIKGFFPIEELDTYTNDGSRFLSHTSHYIPGVEISAGSLGHALPIAVGIAMAAKRKQATWKTICLISDGELNEGSNWEAIMISPQHELDDLVLIVDYNKIQSLGFVKDVIDIEPLKAKFEAFKWNVKEIDGHNHTAIKLVLSTLDTNSKQPTVIIAHTVKGKGVDYMENKLLWHYKSPNEEQYETALKNFK